LISLLLITQFATVLFMAKIEEASLQIFINILSDLA